MHTSRREAEIGLRSGQPWCASPRASEALRCYGHWLFHESEVYRELTGDGSGSITEAELRRQTRALVQLVDPDLSAPTEHVIVRGPPPVVPAAEEPPGAAVSVVGKSLSGLGRLVAEAVDRTGVIGGLARSVRRRFEQPEEDDDEMDPFEADVRRRFAELERRPEEDD